MARRTDEDLCCMVVSCLTVLINTVTDWSIWWVEKKLQVPMLIWRAWTIFTLVMTIGCIVCSILTFFEFRDRKMSRREHISSAVYIDAAITGLHDGLQCLMSFAILAAYTYYYYYSCTKPTPVADESGYDGLETVRAILVSSIVSFYITAYRFMRKIQYYDNTRTCTDTFYGLISMCNVIIIIFASLLWYVGVC